MSCIVFMLFSSSNAYMIHVHIRCVYLSVFYIYFLMSLCFFSGVGRWPWGVSISFFRFQRKNAKLSSVHNSPANTQALIEALDKVPKHDARSISSYLHGGDGYAVFRQLATKLLLDKHITHVLWADCPNQSIQLSPGDGKATAKMCRAVRTQILKMLRVGVFEWIGFSPPVCPPDRPPAIQPPSVDTPRKRVRISSM